LDELSFDLLLSDEFEWTLHGPQVHLPVAPVLSAEISDTRYSELDGLSFDHLLSDDLLSDESILYGPQVHLPMTPVKPGNTPIRPSNTPVRPSNTQVVEREN
jgi:hypothetical protein